MNLIILTIITFYIHEKIVLTRIGDMKEVEITNSQTDSNIPIPNFSQYAGHDKKHVIKHGSLQKFIDGAEEASDYGPKVFPDEY